MEQQAIILVATITAKQGREKQLANELRELTAATQKEAGCVQFDVHRDLDNPGVFVLWEYFINQAAFAEHMKMPYTMAYFARQCALSTEVVKLQRL